jgi:hypothetical protein
MGRNDLLEATEDEFLRAVSDVTRVHGRRHVIDAILSDPIQVVVNSVTTL